MTAPALGADRQPLFRVEWGRASPEELAGLAALLVAQATAVRRAARSRGRHTLHPAWALEPLSAFQAPHSWRAAPP